MNQIRVFELGEIVNAGVCSIRTQDDWEEHTLDKATVTAYQYEEDQYELVQGPIHHFLNTPELIALNKGKHQKKAKQFFEAADEACFKSHLESADKNKGDGNSPIDWRNDDVEMLLRLYKKLQLKVPTTMRAQLEYTEAMVIKLMRMAHSAGAASISSQL
jgi:hypothetical protein